MKYNIIKEDDGVIIRTEDGGLASVYHNGNHMVTQYIQDRFFTKEIDWDLVSESKQYMFDWEDKQEADEETIEDALNWLVIPNNGFTKTDEPLFNLTTNTYRTIETPEEAKQFLKDLHDNGELYHPEDSAKDIVFNNINPTEQEREALNNLMEQVYKVADFDPCEYIIDHLTTK